MCALPQAKETVVLPGGHVVHTVTGHKWVEIPLQYPFPKENEEKRMGECLQAKTMFTCAHQVKCISSSFVCLGTAEFPDLQSSLLLRNL